MPIDLDQHADVVIETLRQMSDVVTAGLRSLAVAARAYPNLSPEQALNDAAAGIERTLADIARKFQHVSRSEH